MIMEERKLPALYLLLQSWIWYIPFSGSPEMHPWGKPGMVPTLCWKMLKQNSLQRMNCSFEKGDSRMWPSKVFSDVSGKLSLAKHCCLQEGYILRQCILPRLYYFFLNSLQNSLQKRTEDIQFRDLLAQRLNNLVCKRLKKVGKRQGYQPSK